MLTEASEVEAEPQKKRNQRQGGGEVALYFFLLAS